MNRTALPCLAFAVLAAGCLAATEPTLLGFQPARVPAQLEREQRFDGMLNPADLDTWLATMAAQPNHVGSPHDKWNADFTLEQFKAWGWDAHLEVFQVLYPTPKSIHLEMVAPTTYVARNHEPVIAGDRASAEAKDPLPPYNAYGADGDVTAEVVYVNRGMPDDYKELERHGISVKGRIVLARYGGGWRGLKPKLAYEHGAAACLIYSDPADDGYGRSDAYPKGGTRPEDGVQRGSVQDMPVYAGDPLTPGVGATERAKRLELKDAKTVLKIPVMPISYADAQPILAALVGPVVPAPWRGALPLTYHFGPGPAKVHFAITSDWSLKPIYNVIATLRGGELPDEWIIRGNHRDGWVCGAWDPLSGHVVMMAEAKALGALAKSGWKPRRTLVYCSWDGEEPGLLGSTEWAEEHAAELAQKAAIYINSDSNSRGFLEVAGSHAYQAFLNEVGASVADPETGVPAIERLRAQVLVKGAAKAATDEEKARAKATIDGKEVAIGALGSGSDYTPFLQHLVRSSLSIEFGGEDEQAGVYHSLYDSYDHYVRFGDPGFRYGVALAEMIGHTVMRLADADELPARFEGFATTVARYQDEVHKLADTMREKTEQHNKLVATGAFKLAADPTETYVPPPREDPVPFLNFSPLDNAVAALKTAAHDCDAALAAAGRNPPKLEGNKQAELDNLLRDMETALALPSGLPGREWFKHSIYAPGLLTGYGVKTLPGVREAIEDRRWAEADAYIASTAGTLDAYRKRLDRITALLKQ